MSSPEYVMCVLIEVIGVIIKLITRASDGIEDFLAIYIAVIVGISEVHYLSVRHLDENVILKIGR